MNGVGRNLSERGDNANWNEIASAIVSVMKTKAGMKNGGGPAGYEGAGQTEEDFKQENDGINSKQCNFNRSVIIKMSEL